VVVAFVQSDLDAINAAIASGELRVAFKDRSVEYRSLDELLKAKALIAAELAGTNAVSTLPRGRRFAHFSNGL
jgi:hypothetical protein